MRISFGLVWRVYQLPSTLLPRRSDSVAAPLAGPSPPCPTPCPAPRYATCLLDGFGPQLAEGRVHAAVTALPGGHGVGPGGGALPLPAALPEAGAGATGLEAGGATRRCHHYGITGCSTSAPSCPCTSTSLPVPPSGQIHRPGRGCDEGQVGRRVWGTRGRREVGVG